MGRQFFISIVFTLFGHFVFAQAFDTTTYLHLVNADKNEFIDYAGSVGLTIAVDTVSQSIIAKRKGCIYLKPYGDKNNNEYYDLALIVSTLNKENNKLILKNAIEDPAKKGTWHDSTYLYVEWDAENTISNEMWYKVVVYRKK
jgi:hypothetical protein